MTLGANEPVSVERAESKRQRWLAVLLATAMMLFSYIMILFAFVAVGGEEPIFAGGALGIGLGLVPLVFATAALVSRSTLVLRRSLLATVIWIGITIPIGIVDLPTALVAGFGAGGMVSLRKRHQNGWQARAIAVTVTVLYTFALHRISREAGLFGGAPLPLLAIAVADTVSERGDKPG